MGPPRLRGRVPSFYLTAVLSKSLVHSMLNFFGSYGLMLLISFANIIRMHVVEEIET